MAETFWYSADRLRIGWSGCVYSSLRVLLLRSAALGIVNRGVLGCNAGHTSQFEARLSVRKDIRIPGYTEQQQGRGQSLPMQYKVRL